MIYGIICNLIKWLSCFTSKINKFAHVQSLYGSLIGILIIKLALASIVCLFQ